MKKIDKFYKNNEELKNL